MLTFLDYGFRKAGGVNANTKLHAYMGMPENVGKFWMTIIGSIILIRLQERFLRRR